jgi:hypothetical protein
MACTASSGLSRAEEPMTKTTRSNSPLSCIRRRALETTSCRAPARPRSAIRLCGILSPTPVREALRILEADGMIVYATHKGATVRD